MTALIQECFGCWMAKDCGADLQRRLRNCLIGMRAETYPYGAIEYIELELYMAWRANGLKIETPAVRP